MTKMTMIELIRYVDDLTATRQEMKRLKEKEETLTALVKEGLLQFDRDTVSGNYATVVFKEIETKRLDTVAVRRDHGVKYDLASTYSRLDLKPLMVPTGG